MLDMPKWLLNWPELDRVGSVVRCPLSPEPFEAKEANLSGREEVSGRQVRVLSSFAAAGFGREK